MTFWMVIGPAGITLERRQPTANTWWGVRGKYYDRYWGRAR